MSSDKQWNKYISCFPDSQICYIGLWGLGAYLFLMLFLYFYEICDFWRESNKIWHFRDVHILLSGWNGPLWNIAYIFRFCALFLLALAQCYFGDEYYYFLSQLMPFSVAASRVMFISITINSNFYDLPLFIL